MKGLIHNREDLIKWSIKFERLLKFVNNYNKDRVFELLREFKIFDFIQSQNGNNEEHFDFI